MAAVNCQYCGHRSSGSEASCAHCGAPVSGGKPTTVAPASVPHSAESPGAGLLHSPAVLAAEREAAAAPKAVGRRLVGFTHKHHPKWHWWLMVGGIALLVLLAVIGVRSCSAAVSGLAEFGGPVRPPNGAVQTQLPSKIQEVAVCTPGAGESGDKCVIAAADPLLQGGITGGRELILRVRHLSNEPLAQIVARWRTSGGEVLRDGDIVVAISAAGAIRYADMRTGLLFDSGTFLNNSGAQTFARRAGIAE